MANFAVADQAGGEVDEGQLVRGLLLPAEEQAAAAGAPTVRHRDHPAPWRVAVGVAGWRQRLCRAGLGREVRDGAARAGRRAAGAVVVATIQAPLTLDQRRAFGRPHRVRDDLRIEQVGQVLHAGALRPREDRGDRDAPPLGQQVPLTATPPAGGYPAISGVR